MTIWFSKSVSSTSTFGAGTPQGTISGDFKLVLSDLTFNTNYIKCVVSNMLMMTHFKPPYNALILSYKHFIYETCILEIFGLADNIYFLSKSGLSVILLNLDDGDDDDDDDDDDT